MSDYIKREDVIKAFKRVLDEDFPYISEETPRERIVAIPSADVVEVVRCKECKYSSIADFNDYEDEYRCELLRGHLFFSGDYCSYGERKEQEHE